MTTSVEHVLELAAQLGRALAATSRFRELARIQKRVAADTGLRDLDAQLTAQQQKIDDLLNAGKPVEPEDKRELERLQNRLRDSEVMQELARAEADYAEMMSRVSRTIDEPLRRELAGEGDAPDAKDENSE